MQGLDEEGKDLRRNWRQKANETTRHRTRVSRSLVAVGMEAMKGGDRSVWALRPSWSEVPTVYWAQGPGKAAVAPTKIGKCALYARTSYLYLTSPSQRISEGITVKNYCPVLTQETDSEKSGICSKAIDGVRGGSRTQTQF